MPNGVLVRLLIALAFGIPSLVLWLVLRLKVKGTDVMPTRVYDWLKIAVFLLLGLAVIADALDKRFIANALNINFWGVFLVANWLQRRFKVDTRVPVSLNISGENR